MPRSEAGAQSRNALVVTGVMGAVFLAAMEATVVATAMPTVVSALGGIKVYSWVFSAFLLASTISTPIWGRLADQLGRRNSYLAGLLVFLLGSALCGMSHSMAHLIASRAIQGLGASSLITVGMTIVGDLYGLERRAKMQGYFSGVWGLASLVGPLIGGVLADSVSWRWVFYINLPLGILAGAAILVGLQDATPRSRRPSFDYAGTVTFSLGITALLLGLVEAGRGASWLRPSVLAMLALSALLLPVFVLMERRASEPVIPLDLFRNPMVRAAAATGFLSGMAMFGAITYVPLFMQAVIGSSATEAGFVLIPFTIAWVVCSILGSRLVLRLGYRSVVVAGMASLTLAFLFFTGWSEGLTRLVAVRDIMLAGIGMGLIFAPMLIAVQNAVPRSVLGSATSVTGFFRTIGGAVGVAVMGSVMAHRLQLELSALIGSVPAPLQAGLAELAAHPDLIVNPLTRETLDSVVVGLVRLAMAHAVGEVFVVGLVTAVVGLGSAFLVPAGQARDLATGREPAAPSRS
ncbi:MAG TPA: MDR family MFS transporter [Methylomirabilota bacterium]|jgi:EmrB/QacA subfamily drug resistance transporter|nr:MDR family MFS transporter [Methylomirabilota bacterium]